MVFSPQLAALPMDVEMAMPDRTSLWFFTCGEKDTARGNELPGAAHGALRSLLPKEAKLWKCC